MKVRDGWAWHWTAWLTHGRHGRQASRGGQPWTVWAQRPAAPSLMSTRPMTAGAKKSPPGGETSLGRGPLSSPTSASGSSHAFSGPPVEPVDVEEVEAPRLVPSHLPITALPT